MGIRTPGLLIANETLYQLSYTPVAKAYYRRGKNGGQAKMARSPQPILTSATWMYPLFQSHLYMTPRVCAIAGKP